MNILGLKISVDHSPSATTRWTRRTGAMAGATMLVIGGGIAYASWSTNGVGAGAAKAGSAVGVTASASPSTSATLLYPNGSAPVIVTIHNGNPFSVKVSAVSITAQAQPDSVTGAAGCTAALSGVSMAASSLTGLTTAIAANSDASVTMSGTPTSMALTSDNSCQGGTFVFTSDVSVTAAAG